MKDNFKGIVGIASFSYIVVLNTLLMVIQMNLDIFIIIYTYTYIHYT